MKIDLSQFRDVFVQESTEHMVSMESDLLKLRSAPGDVELLNAIFRSAHSIKGGAGTFGLTNVVRFTHVLENLLDRLRSFEMTVTPEIIDVLLASVDILRGLLETDAGGEIPEDAKAAMARIEAWSPEAAAPPAAVPTTELVLSRPEPRSNRYRVNFRPSPQLFASGCNPLLLLRNLATLGTLLSSVIDLGQLPRLEELDPSICYLSWTAEVSTEVSEDEVREVFEFVEHLAEINIEQLDAPSTDMLAPHADIPGSAARPVLEALPSSSSVSSAAQPLVPVAETQTSKAGPKKAGGSAESNSIRVSTEKVDRLIDLVGELVIAHVMTEQMVEKFTPECLPQLRQAVASMERSTRELHERVMAIRMLPVGSLFQRYTRTVYDIARSTGKQIELKLSGEETELDKSMLELLGDPLIHLVRNAADHGIELPADRVKAGKPEQGTIRLSACHRAGRIAIELSDDGAGIDPVRVRAKAIERSLISPESELTDQQLKMLVFAPGFSTRDQVSDLSGRGVGMDVVKRNIEQLNGAVFLSSELGLGSTVTIELPLTLAILEGLLVGVGDRTLVLPLLSVIETVSPAPDQVIRMAEQGEAVTVRGESIPLLRLTRFLGLTADTQKGAGGPDYGFNGQRTLVVIVESGTKKIGLVVDQLLGQQQVVLKSLERHLHKVEGLMGATILGDGCAAPIVDVAALARMNLFSLPPLPRLSAGTVSHSTDSGAPMLT